MHLFGLNRDHDYYFELLSEQEQDTQSISRCSTAHHRDFRVVPRANGGNCANPLTANGMRLRCETDYIREASPALFSSAVDRRLPFQHRYVTSMR